MNCHLLALPTQSIIPKAICPPTLHGFWFPARSESICIRDSHSSRHAEVGAGLEPGEVSSVGTGEWQMQGTLSLCPRAWVPVVHAQ